MLPGGARRRRGAHSQRVSEARARPLSPQEPGIGAVGLAIKMPLRLLVALMLGTVLLPAAAAIAGTDGARVPDGPMTMAEVAFGLLAMAETYASFELAERPLARVTDNDPHTRLVHLMQADGLLGDVVSMQALPGNGGLLILHRSRCCSAWCAPPGTGGGGDESGATVKACLEPQPDAPVLLLRDGAVARSYLAGRVHLPHSVTLSRDGRSFFCVDRLQGVVLRVDLETGRELASYGAPWAAAALETGAPLGALSALHMRATKALGPGALCEPASAADAADGRVFVGSGYRDQRIVVFDGASGAVLAEVFRAPPQTLGAAAALESRGRSGDPRGPVDASRGSVAPGDWLETCRTWSGLGGGRGGDAACDANVLAWAEAVAAAPASGPHVTLAEAIAAGASASSGAPPPPPSLGGVRTMHASANATGEWGWQLPHALLVDEARRRLYVANRQRPAVEVLDLETYTALCSYSLRPVAGGDAMAMSLAAEAGTGRLFVGVENQNVPGSAAVVELNPNVCGEALAVYPTPVGAFPQHDLMAEPRPGGGVTFYIAAMPPQAWALPPPAASSSGGRAVARAVASLLEAQVASLLVLALLMPVGLGVMLAARAASRFWRPAECGGRGHGRGGSIGLGQAAHRSSARVGSWAGAGPMRARRASGNEDGGEGDHVQLTVQRSNFSLTQPSRRFTLNSDHGLPDIAENRSAPMPVGWAEEEGVAAAALPHARNSLHAGVSNGGGAGSAGSFLGTVSPFLALSGRAESQLLCAMLAARSFASGRSFLGAGASAAQGERLPAVAPGAVYFVRHGESTSNERGILAGVVDVSLTRFGQLQARRAGADILAKGKRFDVVFTSHLRRAAYTARFALAAAGQEDLPLQHDSRIAERSFGIFAGEPIRLLQLALGYHAYEELMHSAHHAPPLGEPIEAVYARVASFYEEVAAPLAAAGKNVLVFSHQYALEPLALYLSGLPPSEYRNVNLPNGKALSVQDMRDYMAAEGGGWRAAMQTAGDRAVLLSVALSPLFWAAGAALSAYAKLSLGAARAAIVLALAVSSFYALLDVDVPVSFRKVPHGPATMAALLATVRAAAGAAVLARAAALRSALSPDVAASAEYAFAFATLGALLWLLPPALTAPSTSLMWGGGLYLAVAASIALTAVLPVLVCILTAAGLAPGVRLGALGFFFAVAAAGCVAPAAAAAAARARWPVMAKKHSKSWRWLTAPALWMMGFVAGNVTAPPNLGEGLLGTLWLSGGDLRPMLAQPLNGAAKHARAAQATAVQALVLIAASFLAMRVASLAACGVLAAWQGLQTEDGEGGPPPSAAGAAATAAAPPPPTTLNSGRGGSGDAAGGDGEDELAPLAPPGAFGSSDAQLSPPTRPPGGGAGGGASGGKSSGGALRFMDLLDLYIVLTQPNFFLFAALAAGLSDVEGAPVGRWIVFWAGLFFFCLPALEQAVVVRAFMRRALLRSHDTSVPEAQLRALWDAFGGGGDGDAAAAMGYVVAVARALATADSLDPDSPTVRALERYTAAQLHQRIAGGGGGGGGEGGGEHIDFSRFARYFQATGGAVNLNAARS